MKVGFVTCVELGLACMHAIYEAGGCLDFAITIPDTKARTKSGRVYIDDFCAVRGIPLYKFPNINDPECIAQLRTERVDVLFIIGWSQIAGADVLSSVDRAIGIHPTLLPEGRGRASIPWAIIKGLRETGVTMFILDHGVDTGDILAQERIPIDEQDTATTLYARVADAHTRLMRNAWPHIVNGTAARVRQDETRATLWPGRTPADGEIHATMGVLEVDRLVRATTRPYPGAFVRLADGQFLRIWRGRAASSDLVAADAHRVQLADGAYDALEWELEASSP